MRRRETGILHKLGKGWHKIEAANTQSHSPDTGSYGNGTINLIHYLGRWNVHTSSDLALIILATEFLAWQCIAELSALEGIEWQTRIDTHELQNRVVTIIAKGNPIGSFPFHLTTTTHVLETLRTFVIPSPAWLRAWKFLITTTMKWLLYRCSEGCQCIVVVRWTVQLPIGLPFTISL